MTLRRGGEGRGGPSIEYIWDSWLVFVPLVGGVCWVVPAAGWGGGWEKGMGGVLGPGAILFWLGETLHTS